MNKFDKGFNKIIVEDILLEGKKEAINKWGNTQEVQQYIEKFMNNRNGIRLKLQAPYNDIDFWHSKRIFSDFKQFIDNFQSNRQIKKEKINNLTISDDKKGKLIDSFDDYEIWYIGSANSAIQLGRIYKHISSKWCISSDNADYYWNNNHKNDTFYFLIRKKIKNDDFDKLAFEFKANGIIQIWDLKNRKNTFKNEEVIQYMKNNYKWIDKRTDGEIYFKSPNIEIKNNNDGTVNVYGDIYLDDLNINIVPWIKKYIVNELFGNLDINNNNFTSLKNFPKIIHGDLNICDNLLENDDGDLQLIDGDANFSGNNIKISKIKIKGQLIK